MFLTKTNHKTWQNWKVFTSFFFKQIFYRICLRHRVKSRSQSMGQCLRWLFLRIQVSEKLYFSWRARLSFGKTVSVRRRKRRKMARLIVILIEWHENFKVDSKRKTALCALRAQRGRENAGASEKSIGLQFLGKISREKNNIRLRRVLWERYVSILQEEVYCSSFEVEHYLCIMQNLNITLTRIANCKCVRMKKMTISFVMPVFVCPRGTPRVPMEEFRDVLWWLILIKYS